MLTVSRDAWLAELGAEPLLAHRILEVLGTSLRHYVGHAVDYLFLEIDVPDEPPPG